MVVIGGGPAGACAAALLAEGGLDVLVLEREAFPRFRVGESLLPCATRLLVERLGLRELAAEFLPKQGAEFLDESRSAATCFRFAEGLPGTPAETWQVERARFDALLLDVARSRGAEVRHGVHAREAAWEAEEVRLETSAGLLRARYLVDASGAATFLGRRLRSIAPCFELGRVAQFRHYAELSPAAWEELAETGNIKIFLIDGGWMWAIPLRERILSVGAVTRRLPCDPRLLDAQIAASPSLSRLVAGARAGETRRAGDFSYHNLQARGARFVCVGDAACFIDPVFSSGVSLGLVGAESAADSILAAFAEGAEGTPELMAAHEERMLGAYRAFASFVSRFYHTRLVANLFFAPRADAPIRRQIVSLLAGDVFRADNPFQQSLVASAPRGRKAVRWPPPLPHPS